MDSLVSVFVAIFGIIFGNVFLIIYKSKSKVELNKKSNKNFDNFEMQTDPIKQYKK
jgi:hypothetical protein